jgi:RNA polymerase sigma-70 factor (ECF subfamily)
MTFACDGANPGVAIGEKAALLPIGPVKAGMAKAPSSGGRFVNARANSETGDLAQRAREGCRDAFELLVSRHERQIYNYLHQLTGNQHDAEDLAQETFLKAYRGIHRYDASFAFATWLFTIAKRTAYSHFRSAGRAAEYPAKNQVDCTNPATVLEEKDERDSLWTLARRLKQNQYEALWLRYGEGFSVAETAQIMNTNQIHVKVLLHRARAMLAKWLRAGNIAAIHSTERRS